MSFDFGTVPFPLVQPDSDDFPSNGLRCDLEIEHFDPETVTTTLRYAFSSTGHPELEYLDALCGSGLAERVLLFESPESLHRSVEKVRIAGDVVKPGGQLFGRVKITPLIIATKDIGNFSPPNSHQEWGGGHFRVAEGEIMGVGETLRVEISHKLSRRQAMIDLQLSEELDPEVYRIDATGDVIVVTAGKDVRRAIEIMAKDPAHKPALFMSLYKDVIQQGLIQARDSGGEQSWVRALEPHLEVNDINELTEEEMWEKPQKLLFDRGVNKILVNADNG